MKYVVFLMTRLIYLILGIKLMTPILYLVIESYKVNAGIGSKVKVSLQLSTHSDGERLQ